MNSLRRIAALLIVLMIAPPAWAMACATTCAMESQQHATAMQTSDAAAECCHDDTNPTDHSLPGGANDCGMAAACHFAASAAIFATAQTSHANTATHFVLPAASAPHSTDAPPPFKPPA